MEAGKKNITGIFNRATKLQVPYFQRAYVWEDDQWDRFLDDMRYAAHENRHYFMGSVILKQQSTTVGQGDIRTIIDGQQRLTTMMLFFKALYTANGNPELFLNIFTTFLGDIIIEHNYNDRSIFEKILTDHVEEISEAEKESRIYRCFEFFTKEIKPNEIDPNHLFGNIVFVGIDLQYDEDEQQIFDTINSLGVRLTTAELLKNYLFNRDFEAFKSHWQSVFESDQESRDYWDIEITSGRVKRNNIDLFLQAYLFIKIQDPYLEVSADDKERFYKIDSTFNSYKEFITNYSLDKNFVVEELKEYAGVYRRIIDPRSTQRVIDRDDSIGRLNVLIFGLETATIIPYLLYLSKIQRDQNEINKIVRYLESYIMRRIVCKSGTKNYNQLFRSFIGNAVDTLDKMRAFIENKEDMINAMPSDEDVLESFHTSQLTNKQAKGVLYMIESAVRSNMHATQLRDFDDYSLEHVMPKKWRNHWNGEKLPDDLANKRDKSLLTLGNLTLITSNLNSAIRDADWRTKKEGARNNPGLKEFAQGIETFSGYLERAEWNEKTIDERAEQLSKYALTDVWNTSKESE